MAIKFLDLCIKFHHIYQMEFATISKFCPLHLCRGFKGREITTQKRATYAHFISLMRIGESSVTQESYETVQPLSYYAREKIKQVLESEKLMTSLYPLRFIFIISLLSHIILYHLISSLLHIIPSLMFCSVLFCSVLFCSVLFCSVLFCSVLFCSVLFCSLFI